MEGQPYCRQLPHELRALVVPLVSFFTDRPRSWPSTVLSEAATSIVDNMGAMGLTKGLAGLAA